MAEDIIDRLTKQANHVLEGSGIMCEAPAALLEESAAEIGRLRALTGPVQVEPTFRTIARDG